MAIQQIQTPVQFEDRVVVVVQHHIGGSQTSGIIRGQGLSDLTGVLLRAPSKNRSMKCRAS